MLGKLVNIKKLLLLSLLTCLLVSPRYAQACEKIISLAPSITSQLQAFGLENEIIAVSRYDNLPANSAIKKIGGYLDLKKEALIALNPQVIIGLIEHQRDLEFFARLGIQTLQVDHNRLDSYFKSYDLIGNFCRLEEKATELSRNLKKLLDNTKRLSQSTYSPLNVLVLSSEGDYQATSLYVLGRNAFISDLLPYLGASNWQERSSLVSELKTENLISADIKRILIIAPQKGNKIRKIDLPKTLQFIPNLTDDDIKVLYEPGCYIPGHSTNKVLEILTTALKD